MIDETDLGVSLKGQANIVDRVTTFLTPPGFEFLFCLPARRTRAFRNVATNQLIIMNLDQAAVANGEPSAKAEIREGLDYHEMLHGWLVDDEGSGP